MVAGAAAKKKEHLDPDAQRLLLELSTVSEIQKKIAHANAFILRSFRLSLEMEQQQRKGEG